MVYLTLAYVNTYRGRRSSESGYAKPAVLLARNSREPAYIHLVNHDPRLPLEKRRRLWYNGADKPWKSLSKD